MKMAKGKLLFHSSQMEKARRVHERFLLPNHYHEVGHILGLTHNFKGLLDLSQVFDSDGLSAKISRFNLSK